MTACTCVHAAALHGPADDPDAAPPAGCRVGWSGAGEPVPGAADLRHWPAGCTCAWPGTDTLHLEAKEAL